MMGPAARRRMRRPQADPNLKEAYSGSPACRRASTTVAVMCGATPTAAHQRLMLKPGLSANRREPAAFASSIRPSFASGAASHPYKWLKPGFT
jgi:hypothetical protein